MVELDALTGVSLRERILDRAARQPRAHLGSAASSL